MKNNPEIQDHLNHLADLCIENSQTKTAYNDQDLVNALHVFMEVFFNKVVDYQAPKMSHKQVEAIALELGKNMRQTILLAAGIDMHEAIKGRPTNLS